MNADPRTVERFAHGLVERLGDPEPFRLDPATTIEARFGIAVRFRSNVQGGCDIDGSFNADSSPPEIVVAEAASAGRRRFTALHELAHALGRRDDDFQDWLFTLRPNDRVQEERVANSFAGMVLLPNELVDKHVPPEGPSAFDVLQLAEESKASREAVCVRASQRLRGPGLVVLAQGPIVQFAAARALPFGLRRGSDQGSDSFFARVAREGSARQAGVRLRFPGTDVRSTELLADAVTDQKGYTFAVLMEYGAPWVRFTPAADGPEGVEIDCPLCDRARITFRRRCATCGDHPCPDHGCSCELAPTAAQNARKCRNCNLNLPSGAPPAVELCDMCG